MFPGPNLLHRLTEKSKIVPGIFFGIPFGRQWQMVKNGMAEIFHTVEFGLKSPYKSRKCNFEMQRRFT